MIKNKDIKTVIPPLRFPEFRDAEGWYIESLSSIGDCAGGLSGKSSADFGSGEPYVTYKQIFNSSVLDIAKCESVAIGGNEKQTKLQYGDVLITMSSETPEDIGYSSVVVEHLTKPVYLNSFCFLFRPNKLQYPLPEFSRYLFHSPVYRKSISALAQGITRYNISKGKFLNLSLPIPDREKEQQKISTCLGSLDDLISAVADKIEALKLHKKGLMQQLFPAEGKTTPARRFPEFQNAGEWKEKPMEEIFTIRNGYTPSKSNPDYWTDGTIPWFRMEDIRENGTILSDSIQHITPEAVKGNGLFPANSIIVATTATIGVHALIIVDSLANQRFTFLTKRKSLIDKLDMVYFYHYMFIVDEWCKKNINMGGFASVNMTGFKKLLIPIPKPAEQQRIADCLSSVDELISAEIDKLDQLKVHKKGLMQQLFPIINE